ncbi:hypothetical protein [Pseudactinotalea terrae]|uniref:hypothetical protein n=1 Tax=Pseudactinotalea terrae TaxID=1743262 RepID=UPI0012E153F5|nr:hypothetical protein [Pseudactinotalea terrae]
MSSSTSTSRGRFPVAAVLALLIGFSLIVANIVAMNARIDGPAKDVGVVEQVDTTGKSRSELGETVDKDVIEPAEPTGKSYSELVKLAGKGLTEAAAQAAGSKAVAELEPDTSSEALTKASASSPTHVRP